MAISNPNVKKRSVILLRNIVRISSCLPSQFPYTSASLCPFLCLSSLFIGSEFHGFGRLLPCSKYRLSGREGCAICQVAFLQTFFGHLAYTIWHGRPVTSAPSESVSIARSATQLNKDDQRGSSFQGYWVASAYTSTLKNPVLMDP